MGFPVNRPIKVTRGTRYDHTVQFFTDAAQTIPANKTGYTYHAQAAPGYELDPSEATVFAVDATNLATGIVVFRLTKEQTRAMLPDGQGVWQIDELAPGDTDPITPFGGPVRMGPEVRAPSD